MTYSILGWEATNGDLGVACASRFPGVGSLVPYGEAEVGVVATQGFGNPRHGSVGLALLRCGATPQQAVDVLLNDDAQAHNRQFALVDRSGRAAAHTGGDLHTWDGWSGSAWTASSRKPPRRDNVCSRCHRFLTKRGRTYTSSR